MTVSSQTNKVIYIGNGVATEFAIPFSFLEREHIKVRQKKNDIQTERTDWEIRDGNLVFQTAPESGAEIAIVREVPLTQETDYRDNEILHAETLERSFDKLTMQVQQLAEKSARAVTVDIFDDTAADSLIPSIRKAVSDCAKSVESTQALETETGTLLTAAKQQVQTATEQALAAATSAKNAAASETNTAAMLRTKANTALDNLTAAGKKNLADLSMAGEKYVNIALTSGKSTTYTAPEAGYVVLVGTTSVTGAGFNITCQTSKVGVKIDTYAAGRTTRVFCPVAAKENVTVQAEFSALEYCRFVYTKGGK